MSTQDWNYEKVYKIIHVSGMYQLEIFGTVGQVVYVGSYTSMEEIRQELDFWQRNDLFNTKQHVVDKNADKG